MYEGKFYYYDYEENLAYGDADLLLLLLRCFDFFFFLSLAYFSFLI